MVSNNYYAFTLYIIMTTAKFGVIDL